MSSKQHAKSKSSNKKQQSKHSSSALKSIDNKHKGEKTRKSSTSMMSVTKKLVGFVKKGVNIKHQQKRLLPKVSVIKDVIETAKFVECQKNITENLRFFKESVFSNPDYVESEALVSIQTKKCYSHVPKIYFEETLPKQKVSSLLTRSRIQYQQRKFELQDYHDEVQLNLNQQVQHKLLTFIKFLQCQKSIKDLVQISLERVKITRAKNNILKDQIVQRAKRISQLRVRQGTMSKWKSLIGSIKKLKDIESVLLYNNHLLSRGRLISFYHQYEQLHTQLKPNCCKKHFCKFYQVCHYVNFSYQDYFLKSLKSYLSEVIICPKDSLKKIFISKHTQFISVQGPVLSAVDQSIQVQETVVLTVKENIQRQIQQTFRQGMYMCSYQTDKLQYSVQTLFKEFLKEFYISLSQYLNKKTTAVLQREGSKENTLQKVRKQTLQVLSKISLDKYIQILQIFSQSIQCMVKRCTSVIGKLLKTAVELEADNMPQRYQIIVAFLTPILKFFVNYANEAIGDFFEARNVKDNELQLARKIVEVCKEWEYISTRISKIDAQLAQFPRILGYRKALVRRSYDSMHHKATNFDIKKVLQQDTFQAAMINPRLYDIIGYILDGYAFRKQQKNKERNMLSSSLLLEKRQSEMNDSSLLDESRNSIQNVQIHSFSIQQDKIIISNKSFKMIQSTEFMLEYICSYLENYDQYPHLREQVQDKLIQLVLIYQTKLEDLILRGRALDLPNRKVKAKSINAKIISLSYVQVNLLLNIAEEWTKRVNMDEQRVEFLKIKLNALLDGLNVKFNRILEQMQYMQINLITSNYSSQQISQVTSALAENIRLSYKFVQDIIIDKDLFHKFCGGEDWQKEIQSKLIQKVGQAELSIGDFLNLVNPYGKYLPYLYKKYRYLVNDQ